MSLNGGKIIIKRCDLNLKLMLAGGQSFRWKNTGKDEWTGVFRGVLWQLIQYDDHIWFNAHPPTTITKTKNKVNQSNRKFLCKDFHKLLSDYLRVDSPLDDYYELWSGKDATFKEAAIKFHGLRMLEQEPVENLFSFICSSNNNITRISTMVEKMCELYGEKICSIDDKTFYSFPEVHRLTDASVENSLRVAGFGYRAKYISSSAKLLFKLGGAQYLESLKQLSYIEAKQQLLQFQGIGPKVADCICLMSLNHFEAVPVDTHVFQVACQFYLPHLKQVKSVTDKVYREIGDFFRNLYGPLAGWAHTILFCADLKKFQTPSEKDGFVQKKAVKRKLKIDSCDGVEEKNESVDNLSDNSCSVVSKNGVCVETESHVCVQEGELQVSIKDLYLRVTFNCGQTYRWNEIRENVWRGIMSDRVWTLTQLNDKILYTCHYSNSFLGGKSSDYRQDESCVALLRHYFRLDEPLDQFYFDWSAKDSHFRSVASSIYGLRMTRQNIVENLFAFICSSNNTISRITSMVDHLCCVYGDKICSVDGTDYFTVPRIKKLAFKGVAENLKSANFGFRSKYVAEAASVIQRQGAEAWIESLSAANYGEAKNILMKLPGVGAKVADCICLTALDHLETIPVDTHVFQIAKKYYLPHMNQEKTVSKKSYEEIGLYFKTLFGHYAGWAHTVLFCSDLKSSSPLLKSDSF